MKSLNSLKKISFTLTALLIMVPATSMAIGGSDRGGADHCVDGFSFILGRPMPRSNVLDLAEAGYPDLMVNFVNRDLPVPGMQDVSIAQTVEPICTQLGFKKSSQYCESLVNKLEEIYIVSPEIAKILLNEADGSTWRPVSRLQNVKDEGEVRSNCKKSQMAVRTALSPLTVEVKSPAKLHILELLGMTTHELVYSYMTKKLHLETSERARSVNSRLYNISRHVPAENPYSVESIYFDLTGERLSSVRTRIDQQNLRDIVNRAFYSSTQNNCVFQKGSRGSYLQKSWYLEHKNNLSTACNLYPDFFGKELYHAWKLNTLVWINRLAGCTFPTTPVWSKDVSLRTDSLDAFGFSPSDWENSESFQNAVLKRAEFCSGGTDPNFKPIPYKRLY